MRRLTLLFAALVVLLTAMSGVAVAQTDSAELELRIEELNTENHPDVSMVVSVPPEMLGKNLTSNAFTVTEGGAVRPSVVAAVPTDGLQVVLVLDASTSMSGEPIAAAKDAAQSFLGAMPTGVEVAVVSFASEPTVLSPFTTDFEASSAAVGGLQVGGETALYDGLEAGAALFDTKKGGGRILVVLSDGGDTVSAATLEDAIVELLDAEAGLYAIELQSPENDSEALARLGAAADGVVVPADNPKALTTVFDDVAAQIVNRYEVAYTSEAFGRTQLVVTAEVDGVAATAAQGVRYPDPPPPPPATGEPEPASAPIADVAATPSAPREGSTVEVPWYESSSALWLGALLIFLSLVGLLWFTGVGQRNTDVRLVAKNASQRFGRSKNKVVGGLAEQATLIAERTVTRGGTSNRLSGLMERGGVQLRVGELVVLMVAAALGFALLGTVAVGPLLGGVLAIATVGFTWVYLNRRAAKRQEAFADQLTDVLNLMASSIRAGFGVQQSIDTIARELPAPAGQEFQRVKVETQLGRSSDEAMLAMADRVGSEDFKWVVEAFEIHREVGGDLAEILDTVNETVRDRDSIRRRIVALSAEGKISGIALTLIPFALGIAISIINPAYIGELFETGAGQVLILVGLILMVVGALWMRRISTLKF